jgi:hypothetical protein
MHCIRNVSRYEGYHRAARLRSAACRKPRKAELNIKAKKTLEQMKQEKILEPWREKWPPEKAFINADAFIETLYNSLTGHAGQFLKHN